MCVAWSVMLFMRGTVFCEVLNLTCTSLLIYFRRFASIKLGIPVKYLLSFTTLGVYVQSYLRCTTTMSSLKVDVDFVFLFFLFFFFILHPSLHVLCRTSCISFSYFHLRYGTHYILTAVTLKVWQWFVPYFIYKFGDTCRDFPKRFVNNCKKKKKTDTLFLLFL